MAVTLASPTLRARSVAFALVARMLGPDVTALADPATLDALRAALDAADEPAALSRLAGVDVSVIPSAERLAGRWVRWFDLGRVAPYEGSNVVATAGGVTPRLADVAGFYRAFGMTVTRDRPDHIVAQLEFLALTLLAEAEAIEADDVERAEIAGRATRSFLRDHVGGWVEAWAGRVGAVADLEPWFPVAAVAVGLVRSEAARRNVVPLREMAALVADAGVAADEEALLACETDE